MRPTRAAASFRRRASRCSTTARFRPHVSGLKGVRDPKTFKLVYTPDPTRKLPVASVRPWLSLSSVRPDPDRPASARHRRRAGRRRHFPARHRPARARSVFAAGGRDAHLAVDRAGRRRVQPDAGHPARRRVRPLWRCRRYVDPARDRGRSLDPDHPALDGAGRGAAQHLERDAGLFRDHADHLAGELDGTRARHARPASWRCAKRISSSPPNSPARGRCASSCATCCRRSRAISSRRPASHCRS